MDIPRLAVLIIAPLAFLNAKAAGEIAPLARIHFTLQSRLPTVQALVNRRPVALFIDLGMYKSIGLSTKALESVPVVFSGKNDRYRDATGTLFTQRGFSVEQLQIGDLSLSGINGVEFNTEEEQAGTIGFALLKDYVMVFDYPHLELALYRPGTRLKLLRQCGMKPFPIEVVNGVVQTKVGTEKGELIFQFDTGSTDNLLRPSAIGLDPTRNFPSVAFFQFSVLGKDFGRTRVGLNEFGAPNVDGVLGTDFLESKILCVDIENLEATVH
jgi:hypothetical protein